MVLTISQHAVISVGDVELVAIDYTDLLDTGELLTGTPTVTEQTTADLTLANKAVSTASLTILGTTVVTGAAVQFSIQGQQASTCYTIRVSVGTDATPARTFVRDINVVAR